MSSGLDLSFGYTPMQFEKINLLGSELSEHAISSLVLSVNHITYLDLRGNKLNAQFGWRLVKAMKKKYLNLEFCNGVPLKDLRNNQVETLNLSSFASHHGMYGIEVVGAIFLAHFLRLNSSLTSLNFRRNDVEKDGAKALAQSLLGNPQCAVKFVNNMGQVGNKPGIDFQLFRSSQLKVVHLPHRLLDDDDFVFLEEWLRRFDCVEDLDVSENLFFRDGVRKLARYVKDTQTLKKLNCAGLPVDFEGSQLIVTAVVQNQTLEQVGLPLGPCDDNMDRHQMFQQFGTGLLGHPKIAAIASSRPGGLDWSNLTPIRQGQMKEWPPFRSSNWPAAQMASYMWLMAAVKPPVEKFTFGNPARPLKDYPSCAGTPVELWPIVPTLVHDLNRTLVHVSVAVASAPNRDVGGPPRTMELMRVLTRCSALKKLYLLGYGSAVLKESQLPQEWTSVGPMPRWLMEDRARRIRVHWQALYGLLSTSSLQGLETFNDIEVQGFKEQPETTVMIMMQCLDGVAAELTMEPTASGEAGTLDARLQVKADVDMFCDVLRLITKQPLLVNLMFTDKKVINIKAGQAKLAGPLSGVPVGEGGPLFIHSVILKNNQVSETLLKSLDHKAPLKEFCYDNMTAVLPSLFAAMCGKEKPLPIEKLKVEPKWITASVARKRFSDQQRKLLAGVHAALIRSDTFQSLLTAGRGEVDRSEIEGMSPEEFALTMTGYAVDEAQVGEKHHPRIPWRCFPSVKHFLNPDPEEEPLFVPLPLDEEAANELQLEKLSLCMGDLRARLTRTARADEWPAPSKALWYGPQRLVRTGDWLEFDPVRMEEDEKAAEEGEEDAEDASIRFHWRYGSNDRDGLRIGSKRAAAMLRELEEKEAADKAARAGEHGAPRKVELPPPFVDTLLHTILRSLLSETSTLKFLDLRGNGLTREDANVLMGLLQQAGNLSRLNLIPVVEDEALATTQLLIDGSGIPRPREINPDEEDEEAPEGEALAREALEAEYVRMDEGDGFIFDSLVTPQTFPELSRVELRRLEIPQDTTLAHITDALLQLASVRELRLSELKLSGRGASLLLQAVAEMAPNLDTLNGLPLKALIQKKEAPGEVTSLELPDEIEWNDFPLGAMARLNLWSVATLRANAEEGAFRLQGFHLTDVGLRGLCVMLRHFAQQVPIGMRTPLPLKLSRIDLSGNPQITDDTVADLCHTLQHPSMGAGLRHSLRELSVRSCMRLRSRSALELQSFVMHMRDAGRSNPDGGIGALQVINGIDLEALQTASRSGAGPGGGRSSGLPMVLRTFVEVHGAGKGKFKPQLATLSECDTLFFASMLHLWPHIPYCHMHIVIPPADMEERGGTAGQKAGGGFLTWGTQDDGANQGVFGGPMQVTNDSPFPPPPSSTAWIAKVVQAHLDSAKKLFEACPFSTQLRLSVSPTVPGCEEMLAEADYRVLGISPSAKNAQANGGQPSTFQRIEARLKAKAHKRRRINARKNGQTLPAETPAQRPLYVNNINSQRAHCCFRTLYGKDEMEIEHVDIMADERCSVTLPTDVDVSLAFGMATSVDLQHLDLGPLHFGGLSRITEMPVLTHVNLNHNHLGDLGVDLLFKALVDAGSSVVHVALSENNIGDEGATTIAVSLGSLPRLTSLELCENFIQERGSMAIAEAIGGLVAGDDVDMEEAPAVGPLPVLSVDLRGNRSRELGARRWAEVICNHPDLKFLCLAQNELGLLTKENFLDLVCAAVASPACSVLDLQDNFPMGYDVEACICRNVFTGDEEFCRQCGATHPQKVCKCGVPFKKGYRSCRECGNPRDKKGRPSMGPPPREVTEELLADLPPGEFDPAEVRRAVFIRRHRGGGSEKKGRQPQQGQPRPPPSVGAAATPGGGTGVPPSPVGSMAPPSTVATP